MFPHSNYKLFRKEIAKYNWWMNALNALSSLQQVQVDGGDGDQTPTEVSTAAET